MSTGKAQEIAREAQSHFSIAPQEMHLGTCAHWVGKPCDCGNKWVALAEYAVNLALEAACKAVCKRCRDGMAVANNSVHANPKGRRLICRAAAIRAMMEEK